MQSLGTLAKRQFIAWFKQGVQDTFWKMGLLKFDFPHVAGCSIGSRKTTKLEDQITHIRWCMFMFALVSVSCYKERMWQHDLCFCVWVCEEYGWDPAASPYDHYWAQCADSGLKWCHWCKMSKAISRIFWFHFLQWKWMVTRYPSFLQSMVYISDGFEFLLKCTAKMTS